MSDDSDFKYIIRIANADVSGEERLATALTSIRGVGDRISNAIVKKLGLGPSTAPFWTVWGGSWVPLERSWAPCWRFLDALDASWAPLWSHGCFRLDFGKGLGVSWEGLGKVLAGFGEDSEKILGGYLRFRNPRAASPTRLASTMRGGPSPSVVRLRI